MTDEELMALRMKWNEMMIEFLDDACAKLGFTADQKPSARKEVSNLLVTFALVEAVSEGITFEEIILRRDEIEIKADMKRLEKAFDPQPAQAPTTDPAPAPVPTPPPEYNDSRAPEKKKRHPWIKGPAKGSKKKVEKKR